MAAAATDFLAGKKEDQTRVWFEKIYIYIYLLNGQIKAL
jgi:hypothetical protein